MQQRTIKSPASLRGIGLHSGKPVSIRLFPGQPDTGIVFRSGQTGETVPATAAYVVDSHYATTLGGTTQRIQTIEHLLAAAAGLGIDNLTVEITGSEVPAADGSAKPFVALLAGAGSVSLDVSRQPLVIDRPIRVGTDTRWVHAFPASSFMISYTLEHAHPAIGLQALTWTPGGEAAFTRDLAPARTYGMLDDLGSLRRHGLALGASLDNAIGVGRHGVLNRLRFSDEFVRHKILDLVGDLHLLGRPVLGHVVARNAGHALNVALVHAILATVNGAQAVSAATSRAPSANGRPGGATSPVPAAVNSATSRT